MERGKGKAKGKGELERGEEDKSGMRSGVCAACEVREVRGFDGEQEEAGLYRFEGRSRHEAYSTVDHGLSATIRKLLRDGRGGRIVLDAIERRGGRGIRSGFDLGFDAVGRFFPLLANESKRVVCGPTQSRGRVRFQSDRMRFVNTSVSDRTEESWQRPPGKQVSHRVEERNQSSCHVPW